MQIDTWRVSNYFSYKVRAVTARQMKKINTSYIAIFGLIYNGMEKLEIDNLI